MAAAKTATLSKFTVEATDDGYRVRIEDDAGGKLELLASAEQLDLIAETVDDILGSDDAVDEVGGDEVDDDEVEGDEADDDEVEDDEVADNAKG